MSIVCQCPFCSKGYKLKDELAGKRVNCNNPKCGKSFPVPAPQEAMANGPSINHAELDALAAAAFADDPVVDKPKAEEFLQVTCTGCDHIWQVTADKEGKNVPCPECRKVNRVQPRKQEKKVDWRGGNDGRPTYAKREEAPKVEGAIDASNVGGIGTETAREILKTQEEPEEPSVIRKRWAKRILLGLAAIVLVGGGGSYLLSARRESKNEYSISQAIEEVKHKEHGHGDKAKHFHAVVFRAAGEFHARDAKTLKEYEDATHNFQNARTNAKGNSADHMGLLAEVASSIPPLLEAGLRVEEAKAKQHFLTETRQTLTLINDAELLHDTLRAITRKLVERQQTAVAVELASLANQLGRGEAVGQVALELVRLNKKPEAEEILSKHAADVSPAMVTLRMALNKPLPKGQENTPITRVSESEGVALAGDFAKAKTRATANQPGKPDEKPRALIAVAYAVHESQPQLAAEMLDAAAKLITGEAKGLVPPWVIVRACRVYALIGKPTEAEKLADALPDATTKAWGKLEAFRGKLLQAKAAKTKGTDTWLDDVGDPTKSVAAAKAREELARHNATIDGSYQRTIESWPKGTVKPFGIAGSILGQQDKQ